LTRENLGIPLVDYCARHNWVIGSPATVAHRLEKIYAQAGGFGTLLVMGNG
jgi:alkanesulfonate monooxygenase SsuD/methylene tetrahydromethanopterin reductase-like flavin-dependent oxidoreductase (luciferase family)